MAAGISSGNYIQESKEGGFYPFHEDYCRRSNKIVAELSREIVAARDSRFDLRTFFLEKLPCLGKQRRDIAIDHNIEDGDEFGKLRWVDGQIIHIRPTTGLIGPYSHYSDKMKESLRVFMQGMFSMDIVNEASRYEDLKPASKQDQSSRFKVNVYDSETLLEKVVSQPMSFDDLVNKITNSGKADENTIQLLEELVDAKDPDGKPFSEKLKKTVFLCTRELAREYKKQFPHAFTAESHLSTIKHLIMIYPSPTVERFTPGLDVERYLEEGYKFVQTGNNQLLVKGELGNLRSHVCIATSRLKFEGQFYALSEYHFWTHMSLDVDPLDWMVDQKKPITVIHHDSFLLEKTIDFAAEFFEKAVLSTDVDETKESCALFRYTFAHLMPYSRGSAAIAEWIERAIYSSKGLILSYNVNRQVDLEALTALHYATFRDEYDDMIILEKEEVV